MDPVLLPFPVIFGFLAGRWWSRSEARILTRPSGNAEELPRATGPLLREPASRAEVHQLAPALTTSESRVLFPELGELEAILRNAVSRRRPGVNVLIHGPSGNGQELLVDHLARHCGAEWRSTAPFAYSHDTFLQALSANPQRSLLVVEQAERVLGNDFGSLLQERPRRALLEAMDRSGGPVIWLAHPPGAGPGGGLEPDLAARFSASMRIDPPSPQGRLALLERLVPGRGIIPTAALSELADQFEVGLDQLVGAVSAALLRSDGPPTAQHLREALASSVRLTNGQASSRRTLPSSSYRLDAVSASTDLERLCARLAGVRPGPPQAALCLHGPSGTGKSEFARHLARRLGRKLHALRVSEIEDCLVGETEKNVARAFQAARQEGAVLLFDEADSFLRARAGAPSRFELTLVNEFLQQLEAFPGVVICTTNLLGELDVAVLRRFTFKVAFDYVTPGQAITLFETHLAPLLTAPLEKSDRTALAMTLRGLGRLAPGDFAVVARRATLMKGLWAASDLVAELELEIRARGDYRGTPPLLLS